MAVITLTLCMMFKTADNLQPVKIDGSQGGDAGGDSTVSGDGETCTGWSWRTDGSCGDANEEREFNAADMILMTVVRCSAILYCYYQFRSLHKFGSKYTLGESIMSFCRGSSDKTATCFVVDNNMGFQEEVVSMGQVMNTHF